MKNAKSLQMGFLLILMIILGTTSTACASDGATFGPQTTNGELLWRLLSATDAVNSNLSRIETALVDASHSLSETGIDGPATRAVLSNLTMWDASVIDCITIDVNGAVREVEPMSFESVKIAACFLKVPWQHSSPRETPRYGWARQMMQRFCSTPIPPRYCSIEALPCTRIIPNF